jgi:hypothetical protein
MDPQPWWVGIVFKLTTVTTGGNNLTCFTLPLLIGNPPVKEITTE